MLIEIETMMKGLKQPYIHCSVQRITGATLPRERGTITLQRKSMTTLRNNAGQGISVISMATTITGVMSIAITIGDTALSMVKVSI